MPEIIGRSREDGEDEKRDYRWSAFGEEGRKHAGAQSDEGRLDGCGQDWGSHFVAYDGKLKKGIRERCATGYDMIWSNLASEGSSSRMENECGLWAVKRLVSVIL